jgi:hypothetical protein
MIPGAVLRISIVERFHSLRKFYIGHSEKRTHRGGAGREKKSACFDYAQHERELK